MNHQFLVLFLPLGLFVAPITTTDSEEVSKPSHICMNCALIIAVASWSWVSRDRNKESISSTKIIQGAIFRANVKTADASFCDSPYLIQKQLIIEHNYNIGTARKIPKSSLITVKKMYQLTMYLLVMIRLSLWSELVLHLP